MLLVAGGLVACESDSSAPGGGGPTGPTFDAGGGTSSGGIDGSIAADANGVDGAVEAGTFSVEPGIGLANLTGAPIDFCFRPPGAMDWEGPLFEAEGGVPDRAVSVRRPVPVESFVILIHAGQAACRRRSSPAAA